MIKLLMLSFVLSLLSSCGGGSSTSSSSSSSSSSNTIQQATKIATGVAQKGPFSINTPVEISRLDSVGQPTGDTISAKVSANNGEFTFELPAEWDTTSPVNLYLQAKGKVFDESSGTESETPISLTAITQSTDNESNLNSVNMLTHWQAQRTQKLMAEGKSFNQSHKQANDELVKVFGIEQIHSLDFSSSDDESNSAMLLLLSGALMEVARTHDVDPQSMIDEIGDDFSNDGNLSADGDQWFLRMQAVIRDNPIAHAKKYAKRLQEKQAIDVVSVSSLPRDFPLASRPVANVPAELFASPGETIVLDGSGSHDSGNIINFTWFRVDQQTQYPVPVSDRFDSSPTITVPSEAEVLAAPNQEIALLYALVVTDEAKLTHTGVVKVIVKKPPIDNTPPLVEPQQLTTDEDVPLKITLTGSDEDGDPIVFNLNTPLSTTNGIIELDPDLGSALPNVVYTPTTDYFGSDSFTFLVNDGFESSNVATIDIEVTAINDAPIADPQSISTQEGEPINITLTGSDVDNDDTSLNYSYDSIDPENGSLSGTPPDIIYTPNSSFTGYDEFNFTVNDGLLYSDPALVSINVGALNKIPVANSFGVDVNQGETILLDGMGGTDDDVGDTLTIVERTNPAGGVIDVTGVGSTATYEYTSDDDFFGVDTFTYKVFDGKDNSLPATVTINVNDRPVADAGSAQTVNAGSQVRLNGTGSDTEDGADVTYSWTSPVGIVLDDASSEDPTFDAPTGISTTETFTFNLIVRDKKSFASKVSSVVVTVEPASINTKPTAESFEIIIIPGNYNDIELRGFDADTGETDSLIYEIVSAPSKGELDLYGAQSDEKFADYYANGWSIPSDIGAIDQFEYRVTDIHGAVSEIATVTLNLPDPKVPVADARGDTMINGGETHYTSGSGYDIDGDVVKYVWRQLEGEPVLINVTSTNGRSINFDAPTVAKDEKKELKFGLIVQDNDGYDSLEDTVVFTVVHACYLIANAGVDRQELSGTDSVKLYGSEDPGGNCQEFFPYTEYSWEQVDSSGNPVSTSNPDKVNLINPTTDQPSFVAPQVSSGVLSLYFKLQVTDSGYDNTANESDIVKIDIVPIGTTIPNQKPIAKTNNLEIEVSRLGYSETIDFYAEDPDGDIKALTYRIVEKPVDVDVGVLSDVESYMPGSGYVVYTPKYPVSNETYSFKFIAIDHYGAESDPVEVVLKPAPIPSGNEKPSIDPLTFSIKNSEISWNSLRTFEAFNLEDNGFTITDPEDDYYELRKVDETLSGLTFSFARSTSSGWSIYISNPSGSATSSGTLRYIVVDEHGNESEIATFTVTDN
ncbi:Ig-like domain-containing protein [Cocleimonas flava]|nr:Ig-like domain-containing protein [Cocleimonas flava]